MESRLSKALFGVRKMTDEGTFTARVMEEIRQRRPFPLPWPRFLRWALPALGVAMATFLFVLRSPLAALSPSTDTALSVSQNADDDPLVSSMEVSQ